MFRFWLCQFLNSLGLGHELYVIQTFTPHSRRLGCTNCKNVSWGMNDDCQALLKWDKDMEDMYKSLGHHIVKI